MMNRKEVLELIHQNGVGEDIECSLGSKSDGNHVNFWSSIYNYKYNKGFIKAHLDKNNHIEHEKNLKNFSYCEFIIKRAGKYPCDVCLYCSFIRSEENSIHLRIFKIKYRNEQDKEVTVKYESFVG